MDNELAEQEEQYIRHAVLIELGRIKDVDDTEQLVRLRFWQKRSSEDLMRATSEIVKRVHLARGGRISDLRVDRSVSHVVR